MAQVVAVSGCLVALLSVGAASTPASPGAQTAQARVAAGKTAFGTSCSSDYCHGPEGDGGGAPSLRDRRYSPQFLTRVITEGVPSTAMPGFNKEMTSDQIAQMVAYVLSLSPAGSAPATVPAPAAPVSARAARPALEAPPVAPSSSQLATTSDIPAAAGEVRGDPTAGRTIFFDAGQTENCRFCHTLGDRGGQVGPDLTKTATRPARDLFLSIVAPRAADGPAFAAIAVTMKDGQRFVGVKRDETPDTLRLYDTSSVPPVLRSLLKTSVAAITRTDVPAMPGDYASRYSLKQLLDLVAFVKSMDPTSRAGVTLRDLF
jgi:putative heme-binding domain-containing protein